MERNTILLFATENTHTKHADPAARALVHDDARNNELHNDKGANWAVAPIQPPGALLFRHFVLWPILQYLFKIIPKLPVVHVAGPFML